MKSVVTIGNFDGVHRGHRALVEALLAFRQAHPERELASVVVTFEPHPSEILRPGTQVSKLTSTAEKIRLLRNLGVDEVRVIPFTPDFALTPARRFFEDVLVKGLDPAFVCVGSNFFFGHAREGTPGKVVDWCAEIGVPAKIVDPIESDGEVVSSSRVRTLLRQGQVTAAARLLGRDFSVTGEVVHGDKRGRTIGFPPANLRPEPGLCLPKNGVYLSSATVEGRTFASVTNVGVRPTFKNSALLTVEAHLLNFDGDLYGKQLTVEFRDRIRDEMTFASPQALIEQIHKDIATAKSRLGIV